MALYTVTITEVGANGAVHTTRVRVQGTEEALARALQKLWGKGAIWQPDSGLQGYGQVFKSMAVLGYKGDHSYTSRTNRARLDIERASGLGRS